MQSAVQLSTEFYVPWWYGKVPIQKKEKQTLKCTTAVLRSSESAASGHISVPNIHQPHPWVRGVKVFFFLKGIW